MSSPTPPLLRPPPPPSRSGCLALDLCVSEDESDALALHASADAQSLQVLEEGVVVVCLGDGDPWPKTREIHTRLLEKPGG